MNSSNTTYYRQLASKIKQLGIKMGLSKIGITNNILNHELLYLKNWTSVGYHGSMNYLNRRLAIYANHDNPLVAPTTSIICCAYAYPNHETVDYPLASFARLQDYSVYLGQLLEKYAQAITLLTPQKPQYIKVVAGNAPVLEKALAAKAGIGWYGKNSILIDNNYGSFFFLGEIFIDLPLPIDQPIANRCGNCTKCISNCPTGAIIAPYQIDARRCISYLTGVYKGIIPVELRPLIGTKIFGCDLCQQVCPWNKGKNLITPGISLQKYLVPSAKTNHLEQLLKWFCWDEKEFKEKTNSSPINRITHELWLRNIAIALGNSPYDLRIITALKKRLTYNSIIVQEHLRWALQKQKNQVLV
jgi:epoxyqueuosine reductase